MRVLLIYANKPRLTFGFLPGPYGLEIIRTQLTSVSIDCDIVNPFLSLYPKGVIENSVCEDTILIGISIRNIDDALVLWDLEHSGGKIQTVSCVDDVKEVLAWCRECAPNIPICLGGAAISHMPRNLLRYLSDGWNIHVDTEQQFVQRALNIATSKSNTSVFTEIFEGHYIPVVHRESIYFNFREEAAVRSYSGCPLFCSHCIEHVGTRKIKRIDIIDIAHEVEAVVENYTDVKRIFLADSEVNLAGENRASALIQEIRSREATKYMPLTGYFNPRPLSFDFLKLLSKSAVKVLLTIDHISDSVLSRNGKNFRKHHIETLVAWYRKLELELSFCILLGQPGETKETIDEVLHFVEWIPKEIRGPIYFSPGVRVYPGTPLERDLMDNKLDSRWLIGDIDPIHPFIKPVVYCESWNPFELFEYIQKRSGSLVLPMNSYMCNVKSQNMNILQEDFHNYHIGLASRESDKLSAWNAWSTVRAEAPFLSIRKRIDFLWERGRLALEQGLPSHSLYDWTQLQSLLREYNLIGIGLEKLEHNIGVAKHLLK
jgi:hypothetical protein